MPRTKIVATLGPASSDAETIRKLLFAGMDVARINCSHGSHAQIRALVETIREVAQGIGKEPAILGDLQGPKLRLGEVPHGGRYLSLGTRLVLTPTPTSEEEIAFPHEELYASIQPGARLVIGDGEIELLVMERHDARLECVTTVEGLLESRKGVNLPRTALPIDSITEKDKEDARLLCELGVDYIAMSFVRSAQDIWDLKGLLEQLGHSIPVIAKIEKAEAIDALLQIREVADGIMVARGDLGLDLPPQEVPLLQKRIIAVCNQVGKPVITATQMLQSMVEHPRPTRAEATDVANAILDGTDAVMLSAETASGKFPVESVLMMRNIAEITETQFPFELWDQRRREEFQQGGNVTQAISSAVCIVAARLGARAIVTETVSGYTARQVARHRPKTPVIAVSPRVETHRRLALVWGVQSVTVPNFDSTDAMVVETVRAVSSLGLKTGDRIVITAGIPFGSNGPTNLINVHEVVDGDLARRA